jgi:hypothetical protein
MGATIYMDGRVEPEYRATPLADSDVVFPHVAERAGGIAAWKTARLPVDAPNAERTTE